MEVTRQDLVKRYASMDDDRLIDLWTAGTLTSVAREALMDELAARGLTAERIKAYRAAPSRLPDSASPSLSESVGKASDMASAATTRIVASIIGVVVFAGVGIGALSAFGALIAPRIWTTTYDRQCQRLGYWYVKSPSVEGEITCERWVLGPKSSARR